jgi:hypothetical protein
MVWLSKGLCQSDQQKNDTMSDKDRTMESPSKFKLAPHCKDVTLEHIGTVTAIIGVRYLPLKSDPQPPPLKQPVPASPDNEKMD